MSEAEDGWHYVGAHSFRFEPPDLIFSRPAGDITNEEYQRRARIMSELVRSSGGIFYLADLSRLGSQSPQSAKLWDEFGVTLRAMVLFGASFHHRTILTLGMKVARFFRFTWADVPVKIFATEAEARAWIEEKRRRDSRAGGR